MANLAGDSSATQRGLCLLSLDGGGIRGLSELTIIEEFMERIKWEKGLEKTPIPADYFDLIGGTSTGGLIAILLGRLRLSAAEAIEHYEALAKMIFSTRKSKGKDGIFKASKLEKALERVLVKTLGEEHKHAKMNDAETSASAKCRAFVCAIGTRDIIHPTGPTLFRSYDVNKNSEYNCEIWEAARATTAAPTFFKRITIGPSGSGIDYLVIDEAIRVFGEEAPVACVVSVGTGQSGSIGLAKPEGFQRLLPKSLIDGLKEIATDSGKIAAEMEKRYSDIPGFYNRFNVDRGLSSISLDEWQQLGGVREHTKNYMKLGDVDKRADHVIKALCGSTSHSGCEAGKLTGAVRSSRTMPEARKIVRINVPNKLVAHFVIRQTLRDDITDQIFRGEVSRVVVLQAMGGAGKTQLALQICKLAEETFNFRYVIWIDAFSPKSVTQSYKIIAKKVLKHQDFNQEDIISHVQEALQDLEDKWLVVFDNFDDPGAFENGIQEYVPRGSNGRIVFTSRHTDSRRLGYQIDASLMTEDESLELLLRRKPTNENEAFYGLKIASMLGFLALALDQAGAYIEDRFWCLRDFMQHYHDRREHILKEIPDVWEYSRVTDDEEKETKLRAFTTWELSFNQIKENSTEKEVFLTLAAFLDHRKISELYFRQYFYTFKVGWLNIFTEEGRWDSSRLRDVLSEFQKLSIIQTQKASPNDQAFSIHPVICDWIRLRKHHDVRQRFAQMLMDMVLASHEGALFGPTGSQEYLRHIDSCVSHGKALVGLSAWCDHEPLLWLSCILKCYRHHGRYDDAERLVRWALAQSVEAHSPVHSKKPMYMICLADCLISQRRFPEAESTIRNVLSEREQQIRVAGAAELRALGILAECLACQGRYDDARKSNKQALALGKEIFQSPHPATPEAMQDLADACMRIEQYDEAERLYKQLLSVEMKRLGPSHEERFTSITSQADIQNGNRHYDKADDLYKNVLVGQNEKLGAKPDHMLQIIWFLAICCYMQRRYNDALHYARKCTDGFREIYGMKHNHTYGSMALLSRILCCVKRYSEAEGAYRQTLAGMEDVFGAEHPKTLGIVEELAYVCSSLGLYDEGEGFYKRLLDSVGPDGEPAFSNRPRVVIKLAALYSFQGRDNDIEI